MSEHQAPDSQARMAELFAQGLTTGVGRGIKHDSADKHVTGEAVYIDDRLEFPNQLHVYARLSDRAHARILRIDTSACYNIPGVRLAITHEDIPGLKDIGPLLPGDPLLAIDKVEFVGQPVLAVAARDLDSARRAAMAAVIEYEDLPPVLDVVQALRQQHFVLDSHTHQRGDSAAALASAPHRLQGSLHIGGQEHFYLETQISSVMPTEDGGMIVYCSTQNPTEVQKLVAEVLNVPMSQVVVDMRRMGGGFGGKESQSALFACVAALAAKLLRRPVKLRADRDDDMMVTGKRHCFHYLYEVGYDDAGRILAAKVDMVSRAGYSADLSGPVATRAICHFDNTYYLSDCDIRAAAGKTNTQSNTAFRGFGGPQGAIAIEYIIDEIARNLGKDALDIRKLNFYDKIDRNVTPYGQPVVDNVIHELVGELEQTSEYRARRAAIQAYNATSPVLKKGLALTPVKFGIAFNVTHLNQAGALVHVYVDGSILVNHGGTEMGQGVNTKVMQVVAHELGVDLTRVRIAATNTSKVANTSATAASTGADLNGKAAQDAARQIRDRLAAFAAKQYGGAVEDVRFVADTVFANGHEVPFGELVAKAYLSRVQLWSDGFYATPNLHWDPKTMTGNPFFYFAYGAAVAEVVIDTLTGEWKLLRADALYDAGNSLNPAIDIGQVEGAFIQGMGWLTTEELWWNAQGKLMTHAPSTYKIPGVSDCPDAFTVKLFNNRNVADSIHRSKAVGEPPLLLPFSVFLALRDAISAVGDHKVNPPLRAPATSEAILDAVSFVEQAVQEKAA